MKQAKRDFRRWRAAVRGGWLCLAAGLACAAAPRLTLAEAPADDDLTAWVGERIAAWQPTPLERRLDQIGWAKHIRDALRLAQQHQRPVFLFTYDGESLAGYRC